MIDERGDYIPDPEIDAALDDLELAHEEWKKLEDNPILRDAARAAWPFFKGMIQIGLTEALGKLPGGGVAATLVGMAWDLVAKVIERKLAEVK